MTLHPAQYFTTQAVTLKQSVEQTNDIWLLGRIAQHPNCDRETAQAVWEKLLHTSVSDWSGAESKGKAIEAAKRTIRKHTDGNPMAKSSQEIKEQFAQKKHHWLSMEPELYEDSGFELQLITAVQTSKDPVFLGACEDVPSNDVQRRLGENPNTPPQILTKMALGKDFFAEALGNPSTPIEIIETVYQKHLGSKTIRQLAWEDESKLEWLAACPRLKPKWASKLSRMLNTHVWQNLAQNPSTPKPVLHRLVKKAITQPHGQDVLRYLTENPNTTIRTLKAIAALTNENYKYEAEDAREALAERAKK